MKQNAPAAGHDVLEYLLQSPRVSVFALKDGEEKLIAIAQGTIAKLGDAPPTPGDPV